MYIHGKWLAHFPFLKERVDIVEKKKKGMTLAKKQLAAGWLFLTPATILIFIMSFYPIIQAFITSFKTGKGINIKFADPLTYNYSRMLQDVIFKTSMKNTFLYLIVEVPVMLILAILLAQLLNNKDLKFKGIFRTCIFLPCATSLVSYSLIFKSMFATQGLINTVLQNIEYSVYEAAKIDGANGWKTFWYITVPLLKPTIVMTAIMSINGTLQLFDESVNLTSGGPANQTITMSHYIYNQAFGQGVGNFGYTSAMSFIVFIMVAILAFINLKVGDTRD